MAPKAFAGWDKLLSPAVEAAREKAFADTGRGKRERRRVQPSADLVNSEFLDDDGEFVAPKEPEEGAWTPEGASPAKERRPVQTREQRQAIARSGVFRPGSTATPRESFRLGEL